MLAFCKQIIRETGKYQDFSSRPLKIDCYTLIEQSVDYWAALHYSNRVVMHYNEVSFQGLLVS